MKLKKGDTIIILAGKDKGRTGVIERVFVKNDTVLVPGVNMYKRHAKKRDEQHPAGILDVPRPLTISNVALLDKKTKKPTRIGFLLTKGEKIRVAKKSGEKV